MFIRTQCNYIFHIKYHYSLILLLFMISSEQLLRAHVDSRVIHPRQYIQHKNVASTLKRRMS